MALQHAVLPIEWKAEEGDEPGVLTGYASTFGNVDLGGDVVVKGAFLKTIDDIKANGIPLLADHVAATSHLLGTIFDAAEDGKGLKIKARLSKAPSVADVETKMREGHLRKMSIGYETMDESFEDRDGVKVRLLKEVKLWETSVVVFPMNPEATIAGVKQVLDAAVEAGQTPEQIDAAATARGISLKDSTGAASADTLSVWRAVMAVEHKTGVPSETSGRAAETEPPAEAHWDKYRSSALLAGRPTGEVDPVKRAELAERLRLNESALSTPSEP